MTRLKRSKRFSMKGPDCELSDLDLICLLGQLHQAYEKVQIELTKIIRQNVEND